MCDYSIANAFLFIVRIAGILNGLIELHCGQLPERRAGWKNNHGIDALNLASLASARIVPDKQYVYFGRVFEVCH